ncbi:MAG: phage holin family protein [Dehalococcoidia bacterium]|nr:phage holin family protein [Dehalococcoidia bacterium]
MIEPKDPTRISYSDHFSLDRLHQILHEIIEHPLVKSGLSTGAFAFQWVFNGTTQGLIAVTALVLIDTVTGAFRAYKRGNLSSNGFFRFALKNSVYWVMIATAALVDKTLPVPFASVVMITFLAATEAISIMENLRDLGFSVPSFLVKRLKTLKGPDADSPDLDGMPISTHH